MKSTYRVCVFILIALIFSPLAPASDKPLMKDFMGINGHFHFKPELYSQVCCLVRNYHDMNWDVEKPGDAITFPVCVNNVNWKQHVYGKWSQHGFENDICVQFQKFGRENPDYKKLWQGQLDWAYQYGLQMATYFGPTHGENLCTSLEIGNEPGVEFDDQLYQQIFRKMAQGIRDGDPALQIVTCTSNTHPADKYHKNLDETFSSMEIKPLYDVINLHVYAEIPEEDSNHPWEQSYPEDPAIPYVDTIEEAIEWRDLNAPDKDIWITEFGWDACTDSAMEKRDGWFEKLNWTDVSDLNQARYIVRSFLLFSAMDIERAYLYFYNDEDKASVHAASGITRNFNPKPSFWAMKYLYETLGEYSFHKIIQQANDQYVYQYKHRKDDMLLWVAWSPTGDEIKREITIPNLPAQPSKIEQMPTTADPPTPHDWKSPDKDSIQLQISESPVFIFIPMKSGVVKQMWMSR